MTPVWRLPGPALMFCPADRPDRVAKAATAADAVDLEDAVSDARKPAGREAIRTLDLDPARTVLRVNGARTAHFAADLVAAGAVGLRVVMVPKAESADDVAAAAPFEVIAICEAAQGVLGSPAIAAGAHADGSVFAPGGQMIDAPPLAQAWTIDSAAAGSEQET